MRCRGDLLQSTTSKTNSQPLRLPNYLGRRPGTQLATRTRRSGRQSPVGSSAVLRQRRPPADNVRMCAPFTLRRQLNLIVQELADLLPRHPGLFDWDPTPAFNICPTQKVAAVRPTTDAG